MPRQALPGQGDPSAGDIGTLPSKSWLLALRPARHRRGGGS